MDHKFLVYMQVVMNAHIRDLQRRHGTAGTGHIYQGRYKNSAIVTDRYFLNVCRYVEANPMCAGLGRRAEDWEWSSLVRSGPLDDLNILSPWPVARPSQLDGCRQSSAKQSRNQRDRKRSVDSGDLGAA